MCFKGDCRELRRSGEEPREIVVHVATETADCDNPGRTLSGGTGQRILIPILSDAMRGDGTQEIPECRDREQCFRRRRVLHLAHDIDPDSIPELNPNRFAEQDSAEDEE